MAGDGEVRAHDHERAHQQEHHGHAQGPVLVLERRRGIRVAGDQTEQPQAHDGRTAEPDQVAADGDRGDEQRHGEGVGASLADPALENGVAHARRGDRVDALADVVDLVDDVRAGVEEHPAGEGGQERQPREAAVDRGERTTGQDRDDRRRVGERPQDLVRGAQTAAGTVEEAEPAVVGQADRTEPRRRDRA